MKARRQAAGLTLTVAAQASQLRQPLLSDFERGERLPDVFDFVRWARGLGVSPDEGVRMLSELIDDPSLDSPPIPAPPPRKTKGRPRRPEWDE